MNLYEAIKNNSSDFNLDINPVSYNDIWLSFTGNGVEGSAKVFMEGSEFGIPRFRKISKLSYSTKDDKCNYDRGWDIKPKDKELFTKICKALEAYRDAHPYDVNESELVEMDTWVDPRSKVEGWKVKILDVTPDAKGNAVAKVELFDPDGNSKGEDTTFINRKKVKIGETYDAYIDGIMAMPRVKGVSDFTFDEIRNEDKSIYEAEDNSTKIIQDIIKSKNLPNGTKVSSITDDTFNSIVNEVQAKVSKADDKELRNKVASTLYGMFEESDTGLKATILDTEETGGGNLCFVGEIGDYNFVGGDGIVEFFDKSWGIDTWAKYDAIEDEANSEHKYGDDIKGAFDFECKYAKAIPEYEPAVAEALREYAKTVKNPNYARLYNIMADAFDSNNAVIEESVDVKRDLAIEPGSDEESTLDSLYDHLIKFYVCPKCGERINSITDFRKKSFKGFGVEYYCPECGEDFTSDDLKFIQVLGEAEDYTVDGRADFAHKPVDLQDVSFGGESSDFKVVATKKLSDDEYDDFVNNLISKDYDWIEKLGKKCKHSMGCYYCIEVINKDDATKPHILVEPEGYAYARYAAIKPDTIKESDDGKVKVTLYGDIKEYSTIEDAIKDMEVAMSYCDPNSSEFKRYMNVYSQLKSGKTSCSDELTEAEDFYVIPEELQKIIDSFPTDVKDPYYDEHGYEVPDELLELSLRPPENMRVRDWMRIEAPMEYQLDRIPENLTFKSIHEDPSLFKDLAYDIDSDPRDTIYRQLKDMYGDDFVAHIYEAEEVQDATEKYWDATTIQQDQFLRLMKFNFAEPHGCQYIITNDAYEIERFKADSDEEAIEQYNLFKEGLDSGLIELIPQDLNIKSIVPRDEV
jgi:predicted RNA-binding Zn-ribbon protein involved in translation (DUF1610 family)